MQEIENRIFIETSYAGVTLGALIFPHGTILIDSPLRIEDARSWRAILVNQGSSGNRLLANLDAHPDRTLGDRAMECTIVAHHKTAQVFRTRPTVFKGQTPQSGAEWETYNDAVGTRWATPDITFLQHIYLHWGPPDVTLEHHPGPAAGAIWAIIPDSKVIFVGDLVLPDQPPFLANADIAAWIESLDALHAIGKNHKIVSGRAGIAPFEAVRAQQHILKTILKGMERLAKRNASPDAVESLIPSILKELEFSPHLEEQYIQRLRHGLLQYYTRHYRPLDMSNQAKAAEGDQ